MSNTHVQEPRDARANETEPGTPTRTTVEARCTGHVRTAVGEPRVEYTFEGDTLRDFLESFFEDYDVGDMLIAETEEEAELESLPGENYAKNPEGEQTRVYARVAVNGTFNEHLDGLDTELEDGDRVAMIYPFIYCC